MEFYIRYTCCCFGYIMHLGEILCQFWHVLLQPRHLFDKCHLFISLFILWEVRSHTVSIINVIVTKDVRDEA